METRARRASRCHNSAYSLPQELWTVVLSFLSPKEAAQAASVCSDFRKVAQQAVQLAIQRLWPHHSHRLAGKVIALGVQRTLALVQAHESEAAAHPDLSKVAQLQKLVLPEHRQIAVEWLIEVAWDWQLESTVVYRGAQYLDHYLSAIMVPALSKFQMLAISALRTALKHSSKLAEREKARLPYRNWAEVTDGACTEAEVRSTCSKIERLLLQHHRSHPNAKQRLRFLWYRLYDGGIVKQEHVYTYMLASFLLHLSLLDSSLSAVTPTLLAAAALSLALEVFGFQSWPINEHSLYTQAELLKVKEMLRNAQEELPAKQLRNLWVHSYSYIGTNSMQQPAYSHLQQIVSSRGRLQVLPSGASISNLTSSSAAAHAGGSGSAALHMLAADASAIPAGAAPGAVGSAAAGGAVGAAAGAPGDGRTMSSANTVIVGVVPAAAACMVAAAAVGSAACGAAAAPAVRVTRASAGHQQRMQQHHQQQQQTHHHPQQQQQQPPRCQVSAVLTRSAHAAATSGVLTRHAAAQGASAGSQQQQQLLSANDRLLPTPQRTSLAPFQAPATTASRAGQADSAAVGAGTFMVGCVELAAHNPSAQLNMHSCAGSSSSTLVAVGVCSNPASANNSSGKRCATRELPARRAVASSKYGDLACRGGGVTSSAGTGTAGGADPGAPSTRVSHSDISSSNRLQSLIIPDPAAGLAVSAGSSSPKHGSRGLAALFAGAGCSSSCLTARGRDGMWSTQRDRLSHEEMDRRILLEGTPQPPQLPPVQQLQCKAVDTTGKASYVPGASRAGGAGGSGTSAQIGSMMLAACQAAVPAAAAAGPADDQA